MHAAKQARVIWPHPALPRISPDLRMIPADLRPITRFDTIGNGGRAVECQRRQRCSTRSDQVLELRETQRRLAAELEAAETVEGWWATRGRLPSRHRLGPSGRPLWHRPRGVLALRTYRAAASCSVTRPRRLALGGGIRARISHQSRLVAADAYSGAARRVLNTQQLRHRDIPVRAQDHLHPRRPLQWSPPPRAASPRRDRRKPDRVDPTW